MRIHELVELMSQELMNSVYPVQAWYLVLFPFSDTIVTNSHVLYAFLKVQIWPRYRWWAQGKRTGLKFEASQDYDSELQNTLSRMTRLVSEQN